MLISDEELTVRKKALEEAGGFPFPASQTPWQEIQRSMVDQFSEGMVLKPATKYQRVAQSMGIQAAITTNDGQAEIKFVPWPRPGAL